MSRFAIGAVLVLSLALAASAIGAKPKPPKPPKPVLTVLTRTEQGALEKRAIKVRIESKRGKRAVLEGTLLVDGYPDDYLFKLGPKGTRLKARRGSVSFGLSARKREVLDFAIKTCRGATVEVTGEVRRGRSRTISAELATPPDC